MHCSLYFSILIESKRKEMKAERNPFGIETLSLVQSLIRTVVQKFQI